MAAVEPENPVPSLATKRPLPATPDQDPSRPRKRNATACHICRARKTKCDNKKPRCSYCQSIGAACDESRETSSNIIPDNQAILDRLDRLEWTLLAASKNSDLASTPFSSSSSRIFGATPAVEETKASVPLGNPYFFTLESVLSWPVFEGQYRSCLNLRDLMTNPSPGHLNFKSSRVSGEGQQQSISIELESCSILLDNFFNRIHIKNPILDEKEIRTWARDISFNGIGWDGRSCLVLLVCALGCISDEFPPRDPTITQSCKTLGDYQLAEAWFSASQKRIGTLLSHGGGILEAQCFLFSAVYLMHTFRPFSAWPLFLQALACCQSFQCASRLSAGLSFPPHQFSEDGSGWRSEESVYWTCFKSELENRFELSLPAFNAANLTYPEFLPSPPLESLQNQHQAWYFYLAEIALRRLANQILGDFLPYAGADSICDLTSIAIRLSDFEIQAEQWSELLPPEVNIHTGHDEDILRFILKGHLLNCYESMYWPFVVKAINFPETRDKSLDHLVRKGLQVCVDRIWVNAPGFKHRHHGTWGMMRACTRSAFVLLAAKRCNHLDTMLCRGWEDAVQQVIGLLDFWREECGDAESRRDLLQAGLRAIRTVVLR